MQKYHVAIVGGGIAGLYAAYRLRQAWKTQPEKLREWLGITHDQRRLDVVILERNPIVLGGRIRTADLPFPGGSVRAELGAMRITKRHLLARNLLAELEIRTVPFEGEGFSEHYFLRGKHFDSGDVESDDPAIFPYTLEAPHEKKTPGDLVEHVFEKALKELSLDRHATPEVLLVLEKLRSKAARVTLTHEEWLLIQKHGLLTGIAELSNLGVLNLLHHYLSPEAASFVDGGFGYESVIGNWNVSDAIPWFIADFSPGQGYESIVGSMFEVVEKIEQKLQTDDRFRCDIYRNARVTRLDQKGEAYRVRMDGKRTPYKSKPAVPVSVTANAVFLALPRRPLESLQIEWLEEKGATRKLREWNESLASVRGHRLAKIVQAYRYPWWRQERSQRGTASRTFTDLPLRQVYYLDREWLEERGRYRNEAGENAPGTTPEVGGMIVAYLDGHYTSFWRFITAVQRLHDLHGSDGSEGLDKEKAILKEQEKRRFFGSRIRAWPEPPDLDDLFDKALFDKASPWTPRDRALHLYYYRYGLYERAAAKVKHALKSLHKPAPRWAGAKVPEPVAGAYTFWDDFSDDALVGSGWHTWESGVSSAGIIEKMVCPFPKKKVYVCGEAYSSDQGWIEGALKSVELIMDRLGILLPGDTMDPDAREDVQARGARMRDHVGLHPRMKHTPPMSGNYPVQLGNGNVMVFLSGKIGFKPPAPPRDATFKDEAREALKSLLKELNNAGGALSDLVSVRAFLRTMDDYDTFNGIYKEALEHAGGTAPVRTAIAVHDLPFGARVEVDGIAVMKKKGSQ